LVNATGNVSYANLSVNTNLTGQLRSRNRPLVVETVWMVVLCTFEACRKQFLLDFNLPTTCSGCCSSISSSSICCSGCVVVHVWGLW